MTDVFEPACHPTMAFLLLILFAGHSDMEFAKFGWEDFCDRLTMIPKLISSLL